MIVEYTERETGETCELSLPANRHEAMEIYQSIIAQADKPQVFRALVRMWTASDLYILGLFSSAARRKTVWPDRTGYRRLEIDHDYQFRFARAIQQECDGIIDTSPRGHWKSTWKTLLRPLMEVFRDPSSKIGIFSFDKLAAERHVGRIAEEVRTNGVLRFAWPDLIPEDFMKAGCRCSSEAIDLLDPNGVTGVAPTFGAYTFVAGLPTGVRLTIGIFDDCETEKSVSNEAVTEKTIRHFLSALYLFGESPRVWVNGTYHATRGLIAHLVDSGMQERCFPAEIPSDEPDDVAWWWDFYGGVNPSTKERIPRVLRSVALSGKAAFLHPLDIAFHRHRDPSGYPMQYLGQRGRSGAARMPVESINYYEEDPERAAAGCNIYVTIDPSNGATDPYVAMFWAIKPDGAIYLVDAQRRKLPPALWYVEVVRAMMRWDRIGFVFETRIEEFAQANYWPHLLAEMRKQRIRACTQDDIVRCHDNNARGRFSSGAVGRPYLRLEKPMRDGRFYLPKRLLVDGEAEPGAYAPKYDFISYMIEEEFKKWPNHKRDDVMSSMALLFDTSREARDRQLVTSPPSMTRIEVHQDYGGTWMSAGVR